MLQVVPHEWARPVEHQLEALMTAVSETEAAIRQAIREQDPASEELTRFSSRFGSAQVLLIRLLLDAFYELGAEGECSRTRTAEDA